MSEVLGLTEKLRRVFKYFMYFALCGGKRERYYQFRRKTAFLLSALGLYERKDLAFIEKLVAKGDVVIDVGASFGVYTQKLSNCVGLEGKVFSFEPLPEIFKALEQKFSKEPNITLHNIGLSEGVRRKQKISLPLLFGKIPEPALASVENPTLASEQFEIELDSLDNLSLSQSKVSFIKVDIEGHELSFLRGAKKTIERDRPVIQFEENNIKANFSSYKEFAKELNFVVAVNAENKFRILDGLKGCEDINFYLVPAENALLNA